MLNTYLPTCIPNYLPTCLPTYVSTYLLAKLPAYLPTYVPTHLITYLPAYLDAITAGASHVLKSRSVFRLLYVTGVDASPVCDCLWGTLISRVCGEHTLDSVDRMLADGCKLFGVKAQSP